MAEQAKAFPVIRKLIRENSIPKWFIYYNFLTFVPVIIYPLILFGSIFMFDRPDNVEIMMLKVIGVLLYPLYLFFIFRYNFNLFTYSRVAALVPPMAVVASFVWLIIWVFSHG